MQSAFSIDGESRSRCPVLIRFGMARLVTGALILLVRKYMNQFKISRTGTPVAGAVLAMIAFAFFGVANVYAVVTSQLDLGDRGTEVTEVQTYLATDVTLYPERLVTGYYGQLTKAAVERFQSAEGIVSSGTPATTGYGRVGPQTIIALNAKLAGGSTTGDASAPHINNLNVSVGRENASVSWSTNEYSRGKVYYSTSPLFISNIFDVTGTFAGEPSVNGTLAPFDGAVRTAHAISISGLNPNTTYYYLVVALDGSNNVNITTPASFRTNQ